MLRRVQRTFEPYLTRETVLVEVGGVYMSFGAFIAESEITRAPESLYNTSLVINRQKVHFGRLFESAADVGGSRFSLL